MLSAAGAFRNDFLELVCCISPTLRLFSNAGPKAFVSAHTRTGNPCSSRLKALDYHVNTISDIQCDCSLQESGVPSPKTKVPKLFTSLINGSTQNRVDIKQERCTTNELDLWFWLVETYSTRKFTRETDILPSLSGIASCMTSLREGDYLAGMWSKDVLMALTWNSLDTASCHRIQNSKTPSWSWALRVGRLSWRLHQYRPKDWAVLLNAESPAESVNPFGAVQGGRLVLMSRLIEVHARDYSPSWALEMPGNVLRDCNSHL